MFTTWGSYNILMRIVDIVCWEKKNSMLVVFYDWIRLWINWYLKKYIYFDSLSGTWLLYLEQLRYCNLAGGFIILFSSSWDIIVWKL